MFSFFRKKPDPASAASGPAEQAGERSKGALDWLNADVGELLFGKKPEAGASTAVPAPVVAPSSAAASVAATPAAPPLVVPLPIATPPAAPVEPDRSDWL